METNKTENHPPAYTRVPPNDADAELAVLSSMLFDREALALAYELLQPEDFYRPDYKAVFEAVCDLFSANAPVDLVTLKNRLEEKNIFADVGGRDAMAALASAVSTSANIKHYAKIVADKSTLRKVIKTANELSSTIYEGDTPVDSLLDMAEKKIFDISSNRNTSDFSHIHEVLLSSIEKIENIFHSGGKVTGVSTGFADFDNKTAGLQPSDLILIAARPSMGKTAFALNIAQYAAVRQSLPTVIFSLEMSKEQLVNRLLCAEAMINAQKLRTGDLDQGDWAKIAKAVGPLSAAPLYIDDTPGISVGEMRSKCRKLKLEKGLKLVVIDYLQLMSGGGRTDSRQQEISEISRSLKAIAREVEAPVIALSQLSRACESRADHRPMLSDLRESGAIEQDADVVAFLYRDEYYNPETDKKNQAEIIIAKQRNGPTGTVDLMWLGEFTKFVSMERQGF
ncbi:MAG: replicative DNA helicase [Clostridiales bacterium]|jgi:replicative DNA helicase|nr:replicative DNA helicase [Clostridiales bacterium]